jgi:arylformamidase
VKGLEGDLLALPGKHHHDVVDGFLDAESPLCSEILKRMGIG